MRQLLDVGYQQITALKLGFDQQLSVGAGGQYQLFTQAVDDDVNGALANAVLGTIEELGDFAARAERPWFGYKMRQQAALRAR
jgi:hypothetical protein